LVQADPPQGGDCEGRSQYEQSLPRFNAASRRSGIWQPQDNKQLADEGHRDPAEAVSNDASKLWMRDDMGRAAGQGDPPPPPANP
jgi:hypothetical protein